MYLEFQVMQLTVLLITEAGQGISVYANGWTSLENQFYGWM
jgi:hypothetical protein